MAWKKTSRLNANKDKDGKHRKETKDERRIRIKRQQKAREDCLKILPIAGGAVFVFFIIFGFYVSTVPPNATDLQPETTLHEVNLSSAFPEAGGSFAPQSSVEHGDFVAANAPDAQASPRTVDPDASHSHPNIGTEEPTSELRNRSPKDASFARKEKSTTYNHNTEFVVVEQTGSPEDTVRLLDTKDTDSGRTTTFQSVTVERTDPADDYIEL